MTEAMETCYLVTSKDCGSWDEVLPVRQSKASGPRIFIKLLCLNKKNSHFKENKKDCFPAFSL